MPGLRGQGAGLYEDPNGAAYEADVWDSLLTVKLVNSQFTIGTWC